MNEEKTAYTLIMAEIGRDVMKRIQVILLTILLAVLIPVENAAAKEVAVSVSSDAVIQRIAETEETAATGAVDIQAPSGILMEAGTGQVIFEKNPDEQRSPASITKIMTLILIFDALDSGKIKLDDQVVTSAYAKSMGCLLYTSQALI